MQTIDFASLEETARTMTMTMMRYALQDIANTLPGADAMDREMGTDNGGKYRDQASVYRREMAKR